jgi:hypothetical protein
MPSSPGGVPDPGEMERTFTAERAAHARAAADPARDNGIDLLAYARRASPGRCRW